MVLVFELLTSLVLLAVFVTQVALPVYRGTRMFPAFRRQGRAYSALTDIRDDMEARDLERRVEEERRKLGGGE